MFHVAAKSGKEKGMFVRVVNHDPRWERDFQEEAQRIREILGNELINIFHIGSTAVEGLKAKPIIDMMPVVNDISRVDDYSAQFVALGYEVMGELGIPGRRYFRKGGDNRTHQIHAFQFDNFRDIERHLAVRDYLRAHETVREEYGCLKARLAETFPTDIDGYSDGKDSFVAAMEEAAIKWNYEMRV